MMGNRNNSSRHLPSVVLFRSRLTSSCVHHCFVSRLKKVWLFHQTANKQTNGGEVAVGVTVHLFRLYSLSLTVEFVWKEGSVPTSLSLDSTAGTRRLR